MRRRYVGSTQWLMEARGATSRVVADVTGRAERVYPLSARRALGADGDAGFSLFAADFTGYLETGRMAGLEASVSRHARSGWPQRSTGRTRSARMRAARVNAS
jgi:hypothetical protein